MSELMNNSARNGKIRWHLLVTVSTLALVTATYRPENARAADASDRPSIWIELGGQAERIYGIQDPFLPPFTRVTPTPGPFSPVSPSAAQKPPLYSFGEEAKISFEPGDSGVVFSAAIRFGRSSNNKRTHQQTTVKMLRPPPFPTLVPSQAYLSYPQYADFKADNHERHAILDFTVGKDVGMGLFGRDGTAQFDVGLRLAQFTSSSNVRIFARPEVTFDQKYAYGKYIPFYTHNDFAAQAHNHRSFLGIGPTISFEGSTPVFGDSEDGSIGLDWGINAALLFGRQKARGDQSTNERHFDQYFNTTGTVGPIPRYVHNGSHDRSRRVTVPNLGGFAGLSFRYTDAKLSLGYRADFFFGAVDGGIDTRKSITRGFMGPYASISIGLGD